MVVVAAVVLVLTVVGPRLSPRPALEPEGTGAVSARSLSDATAVVNVDRPDPRTMPTTTGPTGAPLVGLAGLAAWLCLAGIAIVLLPARPRSLVRVLARPRRGPPLATCGS